MTNNVYYKTQGENPPHTGIKTVGLVLALLFAIWVFAQAKTFVDPPPPPREPNLTVITD